MTNHDYTLVSISHDYISLMSAYISTGGLVSLGDGSGFGLACMALGPLDMWVYACLPIVWYMALWW